MLRSKSGALRNAVKSLVEFEFIDGPHACTPRDATDMPTAGTGDLPTGDATGPRGWFTFDALEQGGGQLGGLEASLAAVAAATAEAAASQRPFFGVLGFSQGAALAATLAVVQAFKAAFGPPHPPPPLSAGAQALLAAAPAAGAPFGAFVLCSGFVPSDERVVELLVALRATGNLPLALPSLHIYGAADVLVPPAARSVARPGPLRGSLAASLPFSYGHEQQCSQKHVTADSKATQTKARYSNPITAP